MVRNIKLTVEYDGTDYCGWQTQENGPTIQETLEKAIGKVVGSAVTLAVPAVWQQGFGGCYG